MKSTSLAVILSSLISCYSLAQNKEATPANQEYIDSLKKWEIRLSVNTPEPLSLAGYDYNALTQRVFTNGDREEFSCDIGIGCSRKLRSLRWVDLQFNYTYYHASETRDFRVFYPASPEYNLDSLEINQRSFELIASVFQELRWGKLRFDIGAQIRTKIFSEIKGKTVYAYYDPNLAGPGISQYDQSEPGGIAIGLSPVIRASYFVSRSLSVGLKFSSYCSYYKTGGSITTYQTTITPAGIVSTGIGSISKQSFKGIRYFPLGLSLYVSYSIF